MKIHDKIRVEYLLRSIHEKISTIEKIVDPEEMPEKGVILIRSNHGYDVQVDGCPLGMEISWSAADQIARSIGEGRSKTDRAGYSKKED